MMRSTIIATTLVASATAVTPIGKVIELLQDMVAKGEDEKQAEHEQFAKFDGWCTGSENNADTEIKLLTEKVAHAESHMESQQTRAENLQGAIVREQKRKSDAESDQKKIDLVRDHEQADFRTTNQDYIESIKALAHAKEHVKTNQQSVEEYNFLQLLTPMAQQSFLQLKQEPAQATQMAYEGQSGGILDMLDNLHDKFLEENTKLQKDEENKHRAHEVTTKQLAGYIRNAGKIIDDSTKRMGQAEAAYGKAQADKAQYSGDLDAQKDAKADLLARCNQKRTDFPVRQDTRANEIIALQKAIEVMSGSTVTTGGDHLSGVYDHSGSALVQLSTHASESIAPEVREQLSTLFKNSGIDSLVSLASTVSSGESRFGKIVQLIKDMVFKLQDQAKKEQAKEGWCAKELATNKINTEAKTDEVEEYSGRVESLTAQIGTLGDDVAALMNSASTQTSELQEATEMRAAEKADNLKTTQESGESMEAVQRAIVVIDQFYDSAGSSFVQISSKVKESAKRPDEPEIFGDDAYAGMGAESGGVAGLLEVISSDFSKLESETRSEESRAAKEFDTYQQATKIAIATAETTAAQKKRDVQSAQVDLQNAQEDQKNAADGLDAAKATYDTLKPTCVSSGVNFEERVQKREKELEDLKTALRILGEANGN